MTDPTDPDRLRADALAAAGRHGEAIRLYRRLMERHPDEPSHGLALAWSLHESGRRKEARTRFEALFQAELARPLFTGFAYDELVRICRAEGDWKGLLWVCRRAAAAWPEDPALRHTLAEACLAAGRPTEAAALFAALTDADPGGAPGWCGLIAAHLAAGNPGGAETACAQAAAHLPGEAAVFYGRLAAGALQAGRADLARRAWDRCLALEPAQGCHWMGLGESLVALGAWEEAEGAFGRAAALQPASGACWHRLALLLRKAGQGIRACAALRRALAAEPGNPRLRLALVQACAKAGFTDEAAGLLAESALPPGPGPQGQGRTGG